MKKPHDDKVDKQNSHDPGRRRFLKGVGMAGAGAAVIDKLWIEAEASEEQTDSPGVLKGTVPVVLDVNGKKRTAQVEPRTTLLNTLRNHLDPPITGPKLVCDMGTCGACTVLLDGKPAYSCLVLAVDAANRKITTVEGLGSPENPNAVQNAFVENDGLMCGFCTPGFVVAAAALLDKTPHPTPAQAKAALDGNICRCGTYTRLLEAVLSTKGVSRG